MLRGVEGFGVKHHLHTDRLLSLSEDLPLVSVAIDSRERVEALLPELTRLRFDGLVTLERARLISDLGAPEQTLVDPGDATKLTVYVGRHERTGGRLAHEAVVELFHGAGLAAATVLLGVDGTAHGVRRRARFLSANASVPVMVIGVGEGALVGTVLGRLAAILSRPLVTLERIRVCKHDGRLLARPQDLPERRSHGEGHLAEAHDSRAGVGPGRRAVPSTAS